MSGEYSDFAGRRGAGDSSWADTASRELHEESAGVFNKSNKIIRNSQLVYDGFCAYSFMEIPCTVKDFTNVHKHYTYVKNELIRINAEAHLRETTDIACMSYDDMIYLLQGNSIHGIHLWQYVRHYFSNGLNWPAYYDLSSKTNLIAETPGDGSSDIKIMVFSESGW